eukprot:scaffold137175_cov30-Tisochrysis_lutea.AAC.7
MAGAAPDTQCWGGPGRQGKAAHAGNHDSETCATELSPCPSFLLNRLLRMPQCQAPARASSMQTEGEPSFVHLPGQMCAWRQRPPARIIAMYRFADC